MHNLSYAPVRERVICYMVANFVILVYSDITLKGVLGLFGMAVIFLGDHAHGFKEYNGKILRCVKAGLTCNWKVVLCLYDHWSE